jgi:hypothetical protein
MFGNNIATTPINSSLPDWIQNIHAYLSLHYSPVNMQHISFAYYLELIIVFLHLDGFDIMAHFFWSFLRHANNTKETTTMGNNTQDIFFPLSSPKYYNVDPNIIIATTVLCQHHELIYQFGNILSLTISNMSLRLNW